MLNAISPIDGRYRGKTESLANYFSESALIRYRVRVEIEYYIALLKKLETNDVMQYEESLRAIYQEWSAEKAMKVKEIENTTNHDVKAVEYFIKGCLEEMGCGLPKEMVHFGLTSQDINNTSFPMMVKEASTEVLIPEYRSVVKILKDMAEEWKGVPMLARTHGQPATPTTLGKELMVFVYRAEQQLSLLETVPWTGKFAGASGNFNAHRVAYPEIDWREFGDSFLQNCLGLKRQRFTTQIENYDFLAAYMDGLRRVNTIFIDLCRDIWSYVSMNYFGQRIKAGEVGSSAMPHKVNPIDFENAEGNFGVADALFTHFSMKLPVSRLQRDLTDSTVIRNLGVPMAHTLVALKSLTKGLGKLLLNENHLYDDLEANWAVTAEAIQTVLRSVGFPNPYEALKGLTRGNAAVTAETMMSFIDSLEVDEEVKQRLRAITPHNYTGYAGEFSV